MLKCRNKLKIRGLNSIGDKLVLQFQRQKTRNGENQNGVEKPVSKTLTVLTRVERRNHPLVESSVILLAGKKVVIDSEAQMITILRGRLKSGRS